MMSKMFGFIKRNKILFSAFLLLILLAVVIFSTVSWKRAHNPFDEAAYQRQESWTNDVKKLIVEKTSFRKEVDSLYLTSMLSSDEAKAINKDSFVMSYVPYSFDDLKEALGVLSVESDSGYLVKFNSNKNSSDFMGSYISLLNNSVSPNLKGKVTFKSLFISRKAVSIEGQEFSEGTSLLPTHYIYRYDLFLNESHLSNSYGGMSVGFWEPVGGAKGSVVFLPKFTPKSLSLDSKREFKAGRYSFKFFVPKDGAFFDNEVKNPGKYSANSLSAVPGSAEKIFIFNNLENYVVPVLSK